MTNPISSSQARTALTWSFADRYASLTVNMMSSMVIARLLTPAEIGLFSVALAALILATTLRDLGAGNYLVQEQEITTERVRATWTVQLAVGAVLALITAALSFAVAKFYGEPKLASLVQIIALNYLFNPFGSLTYSWLMREMNYEAVAKMRLASTFIGALVAIGLAWQGFGALGLAWGNLAAILMNGLMSMLYRPKWFPLRPGIAEIRRVLSFGTKLTSTSIMTSISNAAPDFILGHTLGLAAAGYYSRANGLVQLVYRLFMDALYPVALSMFSQEVRHSREFSTQFIKSLQYLTVICWTLFLAIGLMAYPLIHLLYGSQWGASVPIVRWLAIAAMFSIHIPLCTAALVASGNVSAMLPVTFGSGVAVLIAIIAGSRYSLESVGLLMIFASAVIGARWLIAAQRAVGFRWRDLARAIYPSVATAVLSNTSVLAIFVYFQQPKEYIVLPLISSFILGGIGFYFTVKWVQHPIAMDIATGLQQLRRKFHPTPPIK